MSAETNPAVELEIAHVLFIDTVGYSKLLIDDQRDLLDRLNRIVKNTNQVRTSEAAGNLITLPTGDGMALVFSGAPEAPVQCALEISKAAQADLRLPLRMGIHSGPVSRVVDVNDRSNAAGAGINIAERVMGFGDAGHILLSKRAADDLAAYGHWRPFLHEIGEYEVKYGVKVSLVNLHKGEAGNPQLPARCKMLRHQAQRIKIRRRVLFVSLPLLVISAVTAALLFPRANVADLSPKSIAVLPFENLSDEKENAFFTGGVQDEILSDLARVADLKVISRTSTMRYKSSPDRNLRQIAKELGVTYIVEGSVQRVGDHIRVSAQLIDARSDMHMWADRYDSDATDVFRIQSEVAQQVVAQLKAKLSPQEKAAIEEPPTDNLAAYDFYLRGRRLIDSRAFEARQKENLIEATRLLDEAVALDAQFVLAYYQLATAHDLIYFQGYDHTPARLARADAAVNSLVRLRPASGEAHLALAQHLYWGYRKYDQARQELVTARRALPNEPLVPLLAGYIDRRQGRWDESIRELEGALQLDPRNVLILQQVSFSYELLRRFKEMAAVLDRAVELVPADLRTQLQRAFVNLEWHADLRPAHSVMEAILAENHETVASVADRWTYLALYERDAAAGMRAVALIPSEGISELGINFPAPWFEGLFARLRGDQASARRAWTRARAEVDKAVQSQPSYAEQLSVLGMIDAALGNKEDAIREGKRAVELLPMTADALKNGLLVEHLAIIYAWTGEKDLAFEQLAHAAQVPSEINYGHLQLHPLWDPLRGDPRFDKIVASLAPQPQSP